MAELHGGSSLPGFRTDRSGHAPSPPLPMGPPLWPVAEPTAGTQGLPDGVRRARSYIEANWAESISLDELARVSYVSKYHLVRTFRRTLGLPPHTYQMRLRLVHAMRMLVGGASVSRVAYDTGFADQAHLTRAFKRGYGAPPVRYVRALDRCD